MKITLKRLGLAIASAGLLSLYGCGGGSSGSTASSSTSPASTVLPGTAAIGAPIAGTVIAIDVNGIISPPATTSALGAFIVDVSGMTAPFLLNIVGTAGGSQVTLSSIATAAGQTVNITPLTDLIVSTASGQPAGASLAALCAPVNNATPTACLDALNAAATPTNLTSAVNAVIAMIAPLNTNGTNPLNGAFVADGTGLDKVLDQILVSPATGQLGTATVTLIATNTPLGTVVMPATANTPSSIPPPTPPSEQELATATAATTVLPEIQACFNSFSALFVVPPSPAPFVGPSSGAVQAFIHPSFVTSHLTYADLSDAFSGSAKPGFVLKAVGLSPADMSPFSAGELVMVNTNAALPNSGLGLSSKDVFKNRSTSAIDLTSSSNTAWVKVRANSDSGLMSWKMIRGPAYAGCPGGWQMAGTQHIDMHMNARVTNNNGTIKREWAFHIASDDVSGIINPPPALNPAPVRVKIAGPGLSLYDKDKANGVGESATLDLGVGPTTTMTLANLGTKINSLGTYYFSGVDSIESCQDMKIGGIADSLTPCMDESQAGPGKIYLWILRGPGATNAIALFPFQTNSTPISKAFARANANAIFATITSSTPASFAGFAADTNLTNNITFNYTKASTYNATMEHCGINLFNGGTLLLAGEQDAVGQETSCTFSAPYSVVTTFAPFGINMAPTSGSIRVATSVLGNQAVNSISLP